MLISRSDLLEKMWAKTEPMVFIERDEFMRDMDKWEVYPVIEDGELLAIVAENGPEFHFTTSGGKVIPRRIVRQVLRRVMDKHGYAVTKTPKEEERQHRFNRLIGFKVVGQDEYDIHYRIDEIRGHRTID